MRGLPMGLPCIAFAAVILHMLLTACGGTVIRDRPVTVNVPVPQPCALERPAQVATLAQEHPDEQWALMDVRQKAAAVGAWSLDLLDYGQHLDAATAACPTVVTELP